MRKIQKRLKKFEIQPMGLLGARVNGKSNDKGGGTEEDLQSSDLHKQVIRRAESIRSRWQDIPSVSSIFKQGEPALPPYSPRTLARSFVSPCSCAQMSNSTAASSSTRGTAVPS